jgi:hypothetical protein
MRGDRQLIVVAALLTLAMVTPALAIETVVDQFSSAINTRFIGPPPPFNVSRSTDDCAASACGVCAEGCSADCTSSLTKTDTGLPDVLGGSRTLTVTLTSPAICDASSARFTAGVAPLPAGFFQVAQSDAAIGSFGLLYDNNGTGLNVDLSNALGISVIFEADLATAPFDFRVTLEDTAGHSAVFAKTINSGDFEAFAPTPSQFLFKNFAGVNPRHIRSILVEFIPQHAADLFLDRLETFSAVPSPLFSPAMLIVLLVALTLVGGGTLIRAGARR